MSNIDVQSWRKWYDSKPEHIDRDTYMLFRNQYIKYYECVHEYSGNVRYLTDLLNKPHWYVYQAEHRSTIIRIEDSVIPGFFRVHLEDGNSFICTVLDLMIGCFVHN